MISIINSNEILIFIFYKSILIIAVQEENAKIVELLLTNNKIDVNFKAVFNFFFESSLKRFFLFHFKTNIFNNIS